MRAYGPDKTGDGDCAMWIMPFRNLYWARAVLGKYGHTRKTLAKKMVVATPRPKSIRETAIGFRKTLMKGRDYVAIHWRYDKNDFGSHCRKAVGPGNKKACEHILKNGFDPQLIGAKIVEFIKKKNIKASAIFIAAPPKETPFIKSLSDFLVNHDIHVFFQEHLRSYVEQQFSECKRSRYFNQLHDFISQLEQEICMTSKLFMPSDGSSWSAAITMERLARDQSHSDIANSIFLRR